MAAKDKPRFTITAKRKDAPKGTHGTKIGAAFEADRFPGSHRASFREVVAMKLTDGTVINVEDYYFDIKDWSAPREGGAKKREAEKDSSGGLWGGGTGQTTAKEAPADEWGTKTSGIDPGDDIPFARPPRPSKDIS